MVQGVTTVTGRRPRRSAALLTAVLLGAPVALVAQIASLASPAAAANRSAPKAVHEVYPVPANGAVTLAGHGFGHGHGMSQWGAYGAAAVDRLSSAQILSFYYPHTTVATEPTSLHVRVLLSATDSPATGHLQVFPAPGLTATYGGASHVLPTAVAGQPITAWRVTRYQGQLALGEQVAGAWQTTAPNVGTRVAFTDHASKVPVAVGASARPGTVVYRGKVSAELRSGVIETVNRTRLEAYLRAVVPAEMPASWPAAALQAQAVAARTYAAHGLAHPKAGWYDLDGDTRDQAYGGVNVETAATTTAVRSTSGQVLEAGGVPILAQFDAADGGWTTSGGQAYLPAQPDPYDGAIANTAHSWTATVRASDVSSDWPAIGALQQITVTGRDGHGTWGGRVTSLTLTGSTGSVALTGTAFQWALGLRSPWWKPTGGTTPPPTTPSPSPTPPTPSPTPTTPSPSPGS